MVTWILACVFLAACSAPGEVDTDVDVVAAVAVTAAAEADTEEDALGARVTDLVIFPCTALACLKMAMMSPRTKMPRSRR